MNEKSQADARFRAESLSGNGRRLYDTFVQRFDAGECPDIEEYVQQAELSEHRTLVQLLLHYEVAQNLARGEAVTPALYRDRLHEHTDAVQNVFAALAGIARKTIEPTIDYKHPPASIRDTKHESDAAKTETWGDQSLPKCANPDLPSIPGYELVGHIGGGGMAQVFKARHLKLDRIVAIKIPLQSQLATEADFERFMREARSSARLRHANICPIFDVAQFEGRPFLAMAFIDGGTLDQWARREKPSARRAAEMIATLGRAVGYAHEHGVIHRDIKPSNVIVDDETNNPVLMDFGLAKSLGDDGVQLTQSGQVMGTPAYMAPEQAAGHVEQVTAATDVYALGAALYELLAGRPPFRGTVGEVIHKVQSEGPPPPRKVVPGLHRDLETICLKAMNMDPASRYESAVALAEDLERFAEGRAIFARREAALARMLRLARRHHKGLAATIALLLLAALTVGYFAQGLTEARSLSVLTREFNRRLPTDNGPWAATDLEDLEELVSSMTKIDARAAKRFEGQLNASFANYIRESMINRPRLELADIAGIENAVAMLENRDAATASLLRSQLERRMRQWQTVFAFSTPVGDPPSVFASEDVAVKSGHVYRRSVVTASSAELMLINRPSVGNVRLAATFAPGWISSSHVGLALAARQERGYEFRLRINRPADRSNSGATVSDVPEVAKPKSLQLQILRDGVLLRQQDVGPNEVGDPSKPLEMVATREGDRVTLQVNQLPALVFEDVFPIAVSQPGFFGVQLPEGVGLSALNAMEQALSVAPSPLEQGDELFARGEWDKALVQYQRQEARVADPAIRALVRYKQARSLVKLNRSEEAGDILEQQLAEADDRVKRLAGCLLWLIRLRQGRYEDADIVFSTLSSQYRFEQLATLVPATDRQDIIDRSYGLSGGMNLFSFSQNQVRYLERAMAVEHLLGFTASLPEMRYWQLSRGFHITGQIERAFEILDEVRRNVPPGAGRVRVPFVEEESWLLRQLGRYEEAERLVSGYIESDLQSDRAEAQRLLVERARIHAASEQWESAERDISEFLASPKAYVDYREYSAACMIDGFLLRRRGEHEAARQAWVKGLYRNWWSNAGNRSLDQSSVTGMGLAHAFIMSALAKDLSSSDLALLLDRTSSLDNAAGKFVSVFAVQQAQMLAPAIAQMAETPAALSRLEDMAFRRLSLKQYVRTPIILLTLQITRQGAAADGWSLTQEELIWQLAENALDMYVEGNLNQVHLVQLFATWKGTTNLLGWSGVAASLPPQVRGPAAYVYGFRYLRYDRPQEAKRFFQEALKQADPGSELADLASAELKKLDLESSP